MYNAVWSLEQEEKMQFVSRIKCTVQAIDKQKLHMGVFFYLWSTEEQVGSDCWFTLKKPKDPLDTPQIHFTHTLENLVCWL